jgi:hypothetical protein
MTRLALIAATGLLSLLPLGAAGQGVADGNANSFGPLLPRNSVVDVRGVQAVCTGLDPASRDDPRWEAYPLKLEFHDAAGRLVPFAEVAISDIKGQNIVSVRCPAPWLLLGLPAGDYKASVASPQGADHALGFVVPREGQKSVMVRLAPPSSAAVTLGYRP